MTRTERQQEAIRKWIKAKGKGTIVAPTGAGKSRIALMSIKAVLKKYPSMRVLVVVPTITLKNQWQEHIDSWDFSFNVEVEVINTVIKHKYKCDFLILDEEHRYSADSYAQVFQCVGYKLIMGLTATFERLDGKEKLTAKYCPIVEEITKLECLANGWISDYKEYQVLIEVDDIEEYNKLNKEWIQHFEFFQFSFDTAMKMCGPEGWKAKLAYRDELYKGSDESKKKEILQAINYHSAGFMRTMTKRKAFVNNHPKKVEIAKKIMEHRPDCKIITFSNNVKMAEAIENGNYVYTGKTSKKKGRVMIEDFLSGKINHLHSCQRLNEGFDDPDISVGIILGTDSSEIKAIQKRGRVIRKNDSKNAEIFYIIIKDTVESKWFANSHKKDNDYITINEEGLDKVLNGEQPEPYKKPIGQLLFRF
jgi:superfamily II DNA or RNA helicase